MRVLDPPDAYGYTTFCDDIRVEVANKLTFVGIYTGQFVLYTDTLPTMIPKLAMSITYRQRHDRMVLPVQFQIFFPWEPETPMVVDPPSELARSTIQGAEALSERSGEVAFVTTTFNFGISPFTIMSPGILKIRAVRGDDLVRLGGMEIVVQPTSSNPLVPHRQPPSLTESEGRGLC
jgi:hypothetical protein